MDLFAVFLILFFTYIAAFSYMAQKLYKKGVERWVQLGRVIWVMLGFLLFLTGFLYGNIITTVIGLALAFAGASVFFMYHIKSELRVKRFLEVILGAVSIGIIVYGYLVTGSIILEIATLFIVAMIFIAIMLSYFLPKIHAKCQRL